MNRKFRQRPDPGPIDRIGGLWEDLLAGAIRILGLLAEKEMDEPGAAASGHAKTAGPTATSGGERPVDRDALRLRAMRLFRARRARDQLFGGALFGEPAWDLLLALYIRDWAGGRVTMSSLCRHIGASPSSTSRWIGCLQQEGLVMSQEHSTDPRETFVALSPRGRALLDQYLAGLEELLGR